MIKYGLIGNPNLSLFRNIQNNIINKPLKECETPKKLNFHLIDKDIPLPPGTKNLLGLGSKFCLQKRTPPNHLKTTFIKLQRSVRIRAMITKHKTAKTNNYNKSLYIRSKKDIPYAQTHIENSLHNFMELIVDINKKLPKQPKYNLNKYQRTTLRHLRDNNKIIIMDADKNLGISVMKRSTYIKSILKEHLQKEDVYQLLNPSEANDIITKTNQEICTLVKKHQEELPLEDISFFQRSFQLKHRTPLLYGPPKLHKQNKNGHIHTRPVVSKINSFAEIASKYIDYYLTFFIPLTKTYLKDSFTLLNDLSKIQQPLPTKFKILTADAISMYTNIETTHGIETIKQFITKHSQEIKNDIPTELLIKLLNLVMKNNVFRFGDLWFHQRCGTAMGTITAVKYATLYYALHEEELIIPKYQDQMLYFRRYIDDIFIIWDGKGKYSWEELNNDLKFGILNWKMAKPEYSVDFLDLTISIDKKGFIQTRTFEKKLNLHLYLPANSCHPPGVALSLIIGFFIRYWLQNSKTIFFKKQITRFATRLQKRGYTKDFIRKSFKKAGEYLYKKYKNKRIFIKPKSETSVKDVPHTTLIYHTEYHPRGIPPQIIKEVFNKTLRKTKLFDKLLICNRRPKNIRDLIMPSDIPNVPGDNPSDYFTT